MLEVRRGSLTKEKSRYSRRSVLSIEHTAVHFQDDAIDGLLGIPCRKGLLVLIKYLLTLPVHEPDSPQQWLPTCTWPSALHGSC